jgi:hypothetical protein
MLMNLVTKVNKYTSKQPATLLSIAFGLLVILVVSNVLVFLGLVQRDTVIRKMKKYLMVMRKSGVALSEDMVAELKLDEDETATLAEEADKVKSGLVAEGMEEEPVTETEVAVEEEMPVEEEEEAPVEAFQGENDGMEYSKF